MLKPALKLFSLILPFLLLAGCNSVPEGTPPDGPIIVKEPEIQKNFPDMKAAINLMTTSIATRCTPVSAAGSDIPVVTNEFIVSEGAVNNMPMEVWRNLINMGVIVPYDKEGPPARFKLVSEIKRSAVTDERYFWEMKMLSDPKGAELWKDRIEFSPKTSELQH